MTEGHRSRVTRALLVADGIDPEPTPGLAVVLLRALAKQYRRAVKQRDGFAEEVRRLKKRKGAGKR